MFILDSLINILLIHLTYMLIYNPFILTELSNINKAKDSSQYLHAATVKSARIVSEFTVCMSGFYSEKMHECNTTLLSACGILDIPAIENPAIYPRRPDAFAGKMELVFSTGGQNLRAVL